ncbi:translation initiation factor IF-2 [Flavicella sp.]|uniref:translation initiation factor IF-2 n=1 Tax=Flavicella sp. TaxID=2957742 RepID=UPI00262E62CE|nr:translation initiation factor IF-2 [Flavicella sp.]MDG1805631.1 translation initiation factor IF-2 [Flavicella sp.]
MAENKTIRLNKVLRELNISLDRAVEHLASKGVEVEARPTAKISSEVYEVLLDGFQTDKNKKAASKEVGEEKKKEKEELRLAQEAELDKKRQLEESRRAVVKAKAEKLELKTVGKIDVPGATKAEEKPVVEEKKEEVKETVEKPVEVVAEEKPVEVVKVEKQDETAAPVKKENIAPKAIDQAQEFVEVKPTPKKQEVKQEVNPEDAEKLRTQYKKLDGPKLTGTVIDLKQFERPKKKKEDTKPAAGGPAKAKRKRIVKPANHTPRAGGGGNNRGGFNKGRGRNQRPSPAVKKEEPTEAEVQKQVRETLERLQGKSSKNKGAKYRRDKRDQHRQQSDIDQELAAQDSKILKVTEFVTVGEVATMMDVSPTQIISACMTLGMMVTMNQRLDAETISIVADEFNYTVEFIGAEVEEGIQEEVDSEDDLTTRAPIITVMGHVDHGKTSLLDYIRKANVIAGESGGITQHIGAYSVELTGGQRIAFLDTPGHEAFTAMRARGAQVTDLVIIVIAADDDVMPQTKEAISHAQAAGVPIVFAINKIDRPAANPDNVKQQLASMDLLVEDWGGKIQSHDISAKTGQGVDELLEKVLLEAEILDLKANSDKRATGTVVEALLDKGRGYVSTIMVQAGTLKIGDYVLAGRHSGKVKAMFDERGHNIQVAGPSTPVSMLGLDGAPQAGDKFNVFEDEREAKQIATKRSQLQREQSVRTQKHITLDEIGRRIALGDFKELNIILKGDVDGSVEALTDSFQKLSTEEIQVNIIHKGVGAITESDILLASASDAIVIGFNVRPSGNARIVADTEEVDVRMYSIIYDAINDLKDAMEGMLSPDMKEEITGTAEIREVYKISKVGNVAGSMVLTGKIFRASKVRVIRDSIVVFTGEFATLKRFKDDAKEVAKGYDCGMQIKGFNDIKVNDIIEAYQEVEVKKKLK